MSLQNKFNSQRGTAIITALLVVSLVVIAATAMMLRLHNDTERTELLLNADEAYLYAQGSVAWAIDQLNNDWKKQKTNKVIDATPLVSAINHVNGFTIQSVIYDAQGTFNLNNVALADYQKDFIHLLKIVAPKLSETAANNLEMALVDWLTPAVNNSELNNYYQTLNPPYAAPHHPMSSPSELRLIKGMTPALFSTLLPLVSALPTTTSININNAPPEVLASLSPTLSTAATQFIVDARQKKPFTDIMKFMALPSVKNYQISGTKINIASNYFLVKTNVKVGQLQIILYTLLARTMQNNKPITLIVWQTKGAM